jgi:lysophospholipase L1-like esterase
MRRTGIVGLWVVVVLVMSTVAVATASAFEELPEFQVCQRASPKNTGSYSDEACSNLESQGKGGYERLSWEKAKKRSFTGKNVGTLRINLLNPETGPGTPASIKDTIECTKEKVSGAVTGPQEERWKTVYKGCKADNTKCNTAGAKAGEIKTQELEGRLVFLNAAETSVGMRVKAASGELLARYECMGGQLKVDEQGELLVERTGDIEAANKTFQATASEGPLGMQKYMYEEEAHTEETGKEFFEGCISEQRGEGHSQEEAEEACWGVWAGFPEHPTVGGATVSGEHPAEDALVQSGKSQIKGEAFLVNADPTYAAWVTTGKYIALGDSYSSGEGTWTYGISEPAMTACHRSPFSWPRFVNKGIGSDTYELWACSGAPLQALYETYSYTQTVKAGTFTWPEEPQLNRIAAENATEPAARLVSLSIGGNNSGFSEIIKQCYWVNHGRGPNDPACQKLGNEKLKEGEEFLEKGVGANGKGKKGEGENGKGLEWVLEQIHKRAPNAWIRIMLYPNLVVPIAAGGDCKIGATLPLYLTSTALGYFLGWINQLNSKITEVTKKWAAKEKLSFGEPYPAKEALESQVAVVGNVNVANGPPQFLMEPICTEGHSQMNLISVFASGTPEPESFHPTEAGYKRMARALLDSLRQK